MRLCDIASYLDVDLAKDSLCTGFALDSRWVKPGFVFVCFQGEHVDGHDYIAKAREQGAICAIVTTLQDDPLDQIKVSCPLEAMLCLARHYRNSWVNTNVVCVTGSAGKTTTKEMIKRICSAVMPTYATYQNQNNLLGLALTLLNKPRDVDTVILELGINAPGEMQALVSLAKPDIACITNIGACHLEGLESEACIAREKAQIFSTLGSEGVAIFDEDSAYKDVFYQACSQARTFTYSRTNSCAAVLLRGFTKQQDAVGYALRVVIDDCDDEYVLNVAGRYQVFNALIAVMVAHKLRISTAVVRKQLYEFSTTAKRFEQITLANGTVLVEDCYNANPLALHAALASISDFPQSQKILVLGDMLELGSHAKSLHQQVGKTLASYGVSQLFSYGELAAYACEASTVLAGHYDCLEDLVAALVRVLDGDTVVLVKGSRTLRLEQVGERLVAEVVV